ncbi:hypothetical protein M2390_002862 [Mycetocola sp. BIGb0189]|uniref:hypothetical protein n=1 Tax=Mycetocola sp. BIGb0189 TaxID=2940604 RepID=UPI00216985AC|nr:hypothetical protein [Mycetocola sp. BIGb0189]MCS4277653.1 hypothetical protein [Mycetocola sp. BIGb0189]
MTPVDAYMAPGYVLTNRLIIPVNGASSRHRDLDSESVGHLDIFGRFDLKNPIRFALFHTVCPADYPIKNIRYVLRRNDGDNRMWLAD